jgi:hypothetical protein
MGRLLFPRGILLERGYHYATANRVSRTISTLAADVCLAAFSQTDFVSFIGAGRNRSLSAVSRGTCGYPGYPGRTGKQLNILF